MGGVALVTGGAGYVGSHTTQALLEAGWQVVVIDDLSMGHRAAVPAQAELVVGDVCDEAQLDRILSARPFDAVLHFAARSQVGESMRKPLRYLQGNVMQGQRVFAAALRHNVGKVVLSSTASVFGQPDTMPIDERAPLRPSNPYGESKLTLERTLRWLGELKGLRWATLRYFNAAGADLDTRRGEDHDPETHLIPIVLATALGKRESISLFGRDYDTPDGSCVRDYVHVVDLAAAHVRALGALDTHKSLALNLGSGVGASVLEVLNNARRITGRTINCVDAARRAGDPATLIAANAKAREVLGWEPRHSDLETIIDSAWRWHVDNPDGYQD